MRRDPENRQTLILDRWPTQREKTRAFRAEVAKVRGSAAEPEETPEAEPEESGTEPEESGTEPDEA